MIVAIVGSREYPRMQAVRDFVEQLSIDTIVVSGGARGVDRTAAHAARARGLIVIEFFADWQRYGQSAGFRRNEEIVKLAERVVAFWDGKSKGTAHTLRLARDAWKPVEIIR